MAAPVRARPGVGKGHLFVQADNTAALWERLGWKHRPDIDMMAIALAGSDA